MAAKRSGLGKGLDSLISNKVAAGTAPESVKKSANAVQKEENKGEPIQAPIAKVEPNRSQPRKKFNEETLNELAESIKQYGIIQPLIVARKEDFYEIIAGERRWRAAKIAGLKQVPVIVKELDQKAKMEISLIENIQRENLNPIEEALAFQQLIEEYHLKQEDVAERVAKSRSAITNSMRLLKLDERVQKMVVEELISSGHARALIPIENGELQYQTAQKIAEQKLSVRETEKIVKNLLEEKKPREKKTLDPSLDAVYRSLEAQMKTILGTKVTINSKNEKSGKVEIEYYSADELEKIIDLLRGN